MKKLLVAAALALAPVTFATPAAAQELPFSYGDYWDITGVTVEDAGAAAYIDFLATQWKKQQEFSKTKGWLKGYHVLSNLYKRPGEPDVYLIAIYDKVPTAAEATQRDKEYDAFFKTTARQSLSQSADRAKYRKVTTSMMLGEMVLK